MSYFRKIELSKRLQEMCRDNLYPPSSEMLKDRVHLEFADIKWSGNELKRFIKERLAMFYGVGQIISDSFETMMQDELPHVVLRLIIEMRGNDTVFIEWRNCDRAVSHLKTICEEAGYLTDVKRLNQQVVKGNLVNKIWTKEKNIGSLKQLVVGYQWWNTKEPLYISLSVHDYHVDVKKAWRILTGEIPSNVKVVQSKIHEIEEEIERIYQGLGGSGGIQVQLLAPVWSEEILKSMTETIQKNHVEKDSDIKLPERLGKKTVKAAGLLAHRFAAALHWNDNEGFTFLEPIKQQRSFGVSLTKKNSIYQAKPFLLEFGLGDSLIDQRIKENVKIKSIVWVYLLKYCRRQMAWGIWEKEASDSASEKRNAMKAFRMAKGSKKQHFVGEKVIEVKEKESDIVNLD